MLLLEGNRSKAQQPCLRGADISAGDGEEARQGKRRLCQEMLWPETRQGESVECQCPGGNVNSSAQRGCYQGV